MTESSRAILRTIPTVTDGARLRRESNGAQQTFSFAARNSDAEARERALRGDVSLVVEAPAGSGKTGLLIQRYLTLLATVDSPTQVLAITFTRAATDEIRARIVRELQTAADGKPGESSDFARTTRSFAVAVLQRDRLLGWNLLDEPRQMRIQTIDGVCAEIVRLLPVMSGGGSTLTPTEQPRALYARAARRTLLQLGEADQPLSEAVETLLLHRNGNVSQCTDLIAEMLAVREQWGGLLPSGVSHITDAALEQAVRPALDRALAQAICADLERAEQTIPRDLLEELARTAAAMSDRPGHGGAASPLACCAGRTDAPGALAEHLDQWRALAALMTTNGGGWRKPRGLTARNLNFARTESDRERIAGLLERFAANDGSLAAFCAITQLPKTSYDDRQWFVLRALFRVLERALVELKLVFAETGECDFAELALLARAALAHGDGPRAYEAALGSDLSHLLVDEMQDTSTAQYALLETLTSGWAGEGRTLFLVGDPKQSIYLFRQARVERFVETMRERRLGELDLDVLRLATNFRSRPALVNAANRNFERIFAATSTSNAAIPYTEAQAFREPARDLPTGEVWHTAVISSAPDGRRQAKLASGRRHAEEIRRIVLDWRSRSLPEGRTEPWRIGVLVASRQELKPVVEAFKRKGPEGSVPFRAVNVEQLAEQPEILDLLALTRALRHLADRVAWLAVLRAPWCGLALADLHQLASADDPDLRRRTLFALMRERAGLLSEEGQARLLRVGAILEAAVAQTGRIPLPELVESTWRDLGGNRYLDQPALRNAEQFFALLDTVREPDSEDLIEALESRMERLYAAPNLAEDAVELTTIHGAKGLEWDVVLVPELDRRSPNGRGRLLEWEQIKPRDENTAGVVFAPIKDATEDEWALNGWLRGMRTGRLAAERKRLFYVACTRAREALHLFATAEQRSSGEIEAPERSLLEAAWPAAQVHFAEAQATGANGNVVELPRAGGATPRQDSGLVLQLAAAAAGEIEGQKVLDTKDPGAVVGSVMLSRLPLATLRELHDERESGRRAAPPMAGANFARPEGSFLARSLGNAVHAFLEMAANRIVEGDDVAGILRQLPEWRGRIRAVLRADGLAARDVQRLTDTVEEALRRTLENATGRWLLGARTDARSEYALTTSREKPGRVRLDRIFRAGPAPETEGTSHLWIVDFKTGSQAGDDVEAWLETERAKYRGQMETYARAFPEERVNLALWFPLMARLVWWPGPARSA